MADIHVSNGKIANNYGRSLLSGASRLIRIWPQLNVGPSPQSDVAGALKQDAATIGRDLKRVIRHNRGRTA